MPRTAILKLPSPSLVVMVGAAGSGKSSFCRRNFRPSEIVSTDVCRARLSGDAGDQSVSAAAFRLAHRTAEERLRRGRLTVFDATSTDARARRLLINMAARHGVPAVAIVLDLPLADCLAQDGQRKRRVGRAVIRRQALRLAAGLSGVRAEGFAKVLLLRSAAEARLARVLGSSPPGCDRGDESGPFDIIGDVHGCAAELVHLLRRLGYRRSSPRAPFVHASGRRAVFVGDLVDRGPRVVQSVLIVMRMVRAGSALCVPGNHEIALLDKLEGDPDAASLGTLKTIRQVEAGLSPHLVLDGGRLAVAHAGITQEHLGRSTRAARRFAIHGQTTRERDRFGLPVRVKWAVNYRGPALVVYGHTSVPQPEWIRNTVNIDTGCVYGGSLTALRYPERTLVSVKARRDYYRPRKGLPAGVGVRAETRAMPQEGPISGRSAPPPRSPDGSLRWPPSRTSSPSVSLSRRTEPRTG